MKDSDTTVTKYIGARAYRDSACSASSTFLFAEFSAKTHSVESRQYRQHVETDDPLSYRPQTFKVETCVELKSGDYIRIKIACEDRF